MDATVKVIKRGQVVIPKPVRDAMRIETGDLLKLKIEKITQGRKMKENRGVKG